MITACFFYSPQTTTDEHGAYLWFNGFVHQPKENKMTTVRKLLEAKSTATNYSMEASQTVLHALMMMSEAKIGAVLVTEGGKIIGIYTERDYLTKGEVEGRTAKDTKIKDVMVPKMITVNRDTTVDQCIALMKQYHVRHLPVVENDQLIGLVSMRDVMLVAIENRESEIRGLENYIMGSGFQS
jgi:predicted transcriptional regulator